MQVYLGSFVYGLIYFIQLYFCLKKKKEIYLFISVIYMRLER